MKNQKRVKATGVSSDLNRVGILMLLTCVVTLSAYIYLDTVGIYGPTIIHGLFVCSICFFTYKNKRWAQICYYIFSAILILMGFLGVFVFYEKSCRGIWEHIRTEAVWIAIIIALFQIVALYLLHVWKKKRENIGG